jgi:pilus assembly protein Flp/PilA
MLGKIKDFFINEDGQTSTEYILLVVVVAMIVIKFGKVAQERLLALTNGVFTKADTFVDQMDTN